MRVPEVIWVWFLHLASCGRCWRWRRVGGALWAWIALAVTLFLRFAVALVVGRSVLRDRQILKYAWLIPLRDLVAVAIWIASLGGHTVTWRGDRFQFEEWQAYSDRAIALYGCAIASAATGTVLQV